VCREAVPQIGDLDHGDPTTNKKFFYTTLSDSNAGSYAQRCIAKRLNCGGMFSDSFEFFCNYAPFSERVK